MTAPRHANGRTLADEISGAARAAFLDALTLTGADPGTLFTLDGAEESLRASLAADPLRLTR